MKCRSVRTQAWWETCFYF